MSIKDYFNKNKSKEQVTNEPEMGHLELQNQINLNEKIAEAAKAYQQAQQMSSMVGMLKGGGGGGTVVKTGQLYRPSSLSILPAEEYEKIKRIKNENEKLFLLVKDMLDTLEIIASNTETDDPNYWLRRGLVEGYLLRIGELVNEKEISNQEAYYKEA